MKNVCSNPIETILCTPSQKNTFIQKQISVFWIIFFNNFSSLLSFLHIFLNNPLYSILYSMWEFQMCYVCSLSPLCWFLSIFFYISRCMLLFFKSTIQNISLFTFLFWERDRERKVLILQKKRTKIALH